MSKTLATLTIPDRLVTIDFETYYAPDYTLSKLSTEAYIRDPRFECIGVGVKEDDGPSRWMTGNEFARYARGVDWSKVAVLHHHAHFDGLILSHHFDVHPAMFLDTLSMARAKFGTEVGGSLAKLMEHFQVGQKGDEVVRALGKRLQDFSLQELAAYGDYCCNDVEGTCAIFAKLAPDFPELELHNINLTVKMFTEPRLRTDVAALEAALEVEQTRKADLLARVAPTKEDLMSNPRFAAVLESLGVEPPTKISPATGKETFAFAKTDMGMQALLEHENDDVRWVTEARVGVKSTIAESRIGRFLAVAQRGNAPVYLKYHAAHTGRWGGGDKTNFQNLPRGGALRAALCAPEGHQIVACDSAQIEARGLAWISGNYALIEAFEAKRDVYCEFASQIFGRPITEADERERFIGKTCILGLGYGMGWRKFAGAMLRGNVTFSMRDAEVLGVSIEEFSWNDEWKMQALTLSSRMTPDALVIHAAVSKGIVDRYRALNPAVPAFWKDMSRVVDTMAGDLTDCFGPSGQFRVSRHTITLPSGRTLRYRGLEDRGDGHSYLGGRAGKERVRIYGGSLTENVVQAFCRDIVAEQMCLLYGLYGYAPLTMTHDEVVFCVPHDEVVEAATRAEQVMRYCPVWATGIPLNAKAGYAVNYGGAK